MHGRGGGECVPFARMLGDVEQKWELETKLLLFIDLTAACVRSQDLSHGDIDGWDAREDQRVPIQLGERRGGRSK